MAIDNYDNRGERYHAGLIPSLCHFDLQGFVQRHNMYFDLQSGHYVVLRLVNQGGSRFRPPLG